MTANKKTLLLGLDAACWDYLNPLLEEHRMPNLAQLIESGARGTMQSTIPPWTPTAWSSVVTGKKPDKHGIYDMLVRNPGTYQFTPTNARLRIGVPFWKRLNDHGLSVGLVNVPFTYPLDQLNGFVIAGFGAPESAEDITFPGELLDKIREEWGSFEPVVPSEFLQNASPEAILAREIAHQRLQVQIAISLAKQYQVDVLVINLMLTDHANHKMPHMEQVQEAYCQADQDIGELLAGFVPDNVLLFSDHGSSRIKGDFLLHSWLRDHGYCYQMRNNREERSAAFNWLLVQLLQDQKHWSGLAERLVRSVIRETVFYLPKRLQKRLWSRLEKDIPGAYEQVVYSSSPDYQRSKVFPGSAYSGLLYLNLVGREPNGIVARDEYEQMTSDIANGLSQVREPDTGEPLFNAIYSQDELYPGEANGRAPDIVLDCYGKAWNIRSSDYVQRSDSMQNGYFAPVRSGRDFGWHSHAGVFVFAGKDFWRGEAGIDGELVDIPTTLLHIYGIPIPEDYDGQVLMDLLAGEVKERSILSQSGDRLSDEVLGDLYSEEQAAEVMDHLKALGYLD